MDLSHDFVFSWQQDFEDVLTYIEDALEQDVEQLSENGTDRMFHNLSVVFRNLFLLLERVVNPMQADELVSHSYITRLTTQICHLTQLCSVLLFAFPGSLQCHVFASSVHHAYVSSTAACFCPQLLMELNVVVAHVRLPMT